MKKVFKSKSLPGLSKEELNKLTHRKLAQSEAMSSVNASRTKEDYAKIIAKSASKKDQVAAANKRWSNANEETRLTNMDPARFAAYKMYEDQRKERNKIILKWLPDNIWISPIEYHNKWIEEGLDKKYDIPANYMSGIIKNREFFEDNGHSNARWKRFRKLN